MTLRHRTLVKRLGRPSVEELAADVAATLAMDGLLDVLVVQGGLNPNQSHTQAHIVAQMSTILRCPIVKDQS
jgi:hypothetical protein